MYDTYSYEVATVFLPALINGDESGLTAREVRQLNAFEKDAAQSAVKEGWSLWHWAFADPDEEGNYGTCDVTGLFAERATLNFVVRK